MLDSLIVTIVDVQTPAVNFLTIKKEAKKIRISVTMYDLNSHLMFVNWMDTFL